MRALAYACCVCAVLSCLGQFDESVPIGQGAVSYPITVSVDSPQKMPGSKSRFSNDEMSKLTDLNVIVYHDGCLLSEYSSYYEDVSSVMLSFPVGKDGFDIYMLGNVGQVEPPESEGDMLEYRCVLPSYDVFPVRGVPVAGVFKDYLRGTLAHFVLKRLVGQFDIRMVDSAEDADYLIKDVRVMNCAMDVYPFSADSRAMLFADGLDTIGDILTPTDIDALNSGKSVPLYFLENLQGELLPGNTDPKKKIPSSLPEGFPDRCTYVEVTADITTPAARYTGCRYRFYPGRNETTDFSIVRNTLHEVVLDFTQNMVSEQEWRIEADEPEVVGVRVDKEEARVIKGTEDMVYVQAYDNNGNLMDFDVDILSSFGKVNVEKVRTSYLGRPGLGEALGLRFTSNVDLCGLYPYGSDPVYETAIVRISSRETYNGRPLYVKDIKVRIYDKLFPLLLRLQKLNGDEFYSAVLHGKNPLSIELRVGMDYALADGSRNQLVQTMCSVLPADGAMVGRLPPSVTIDNLARIDFNVGGENGNIYMGEDTEAFYGPGSALCPGKLSSMPSDSEFAMRYDDSDGIPQYNFEDGETHEDVITDFFKWTYTYVKYSNGTLCFCTDEKGHGVNRSRFVANSKHEHCPFYFVNGGMESKYVDVWFDRRPPKYNNDRTSRIDVRFYPPGRDLFVEVLGDDERSEHQMFCQLTSWKNFWGKVKTRQDSRFYSAEFYMTINGASSWVGGDKSRYGYVTD